MAYWRLITASSALACSTSTFGFKRPNTLNIGLKRRDWVGKMDHSTGRVTQTSTPENGNWNPSGSTPTMVWGTEANVTVLPAIIGLAPNRRRHNAAPIMATAGP